MGPDAKFFSIRKKLILFLLFLIITMSAVSCIVYVNSSNTTNRFIILMRNLIILNNLTNNINLMQKNLEEYLNMKAGEALDKYNSSYDSLLKGIKPFSLDFTSEDEYAAFNNIRGMVITYGEEAGQAIWASRGRDAGKSFVHMNECRKISGYMKEQIKYLVLSYLSRNELIFNTLVESMDRVQTIIVFFILGTGVLTIIFAVIFSRGITRPILDLTRSAKRVSIGDFDIGAVKSDENDEISILAAAFNMMASNIKRLIDEIKEKADVERKLKQREVENLEISNLLKETELKALQSQINPHFLFNTLSCVAQTALIEGADNTCDLLESVSDLLRYNLRRIDKEVMLEDEVRNLKVYVFIQKARYRNRMNFELNIKDESLLKLAMPCLTLQPIVENAFIHGIENCEKPGEVAVNIYEDNNKVIIEISDTGAGMDEGKIEAILADENNEASNPRGHTTGIGIKNVIKRLRLFYGINDVIHIKSAINEGTRVILSLPFCRRDANV